MRDPLPPGAVIRKLWISEAEDYRDHLLRLDVDSRRNRFAGAVSDDFVRDYAALSFGIDAVIHGFFIDGTLRGAAELRPIGAPLMREAEAAFSIESHGRATASDLFCSNARCLRRVIGASSSCTWRVSPTISGCSSSRGNTTPR
jgi:hypothetical protein